MMLIDRGWPFSAAKIAASNVWGVVFGEKRPNHDGASLCTRGCYQADHGAHGTVETVRLREGQRFNNNTSTAARTW